MYRTLTVVAVLAVLLATVQLYAQDLPKKPRMPEPPRIWPPQPPIKWPPICLPRPVAVELRGYIYSNDPLHSDDLLFSLSRAKYYIRTVDGSIYMLMFSSTTKFYLCGDFTNYVGTRKLVIVKGFLMPKHWPRPFEDVIVTEVRDPAYPHCR